MDQAPIFTEGLRFIIIRPYTFILFNFERGKQVLVKPPQSLNMMVKKGTQVVDNYNPTAQRVTAYLTAASTDRKIS